jgi:hypothetical protein
MTETSEPTRNPEAKSVACRAWLLALAILVPIALALELGGIRRLAQALPSPRHDVFAHHYYQAARDPAENDRPKIFILGSSMAIRGIDAERIEHHLAAAQPAPKPDVIHLGLWENREREKYLQSLHLLDQHPAAVIYTVSGNDMLEPDLDDEEYFVSATDTAPLYAALDRTPPLDVLAKNAFYRSDLGQFRYFVGWRLRQLAKELPAAFRMTAEQKVAFFKLDIPPYPAPQAPPDEFHDWLESRKRIYADPDFTTAGPSRVFLEKALTAWYENGTRVILVNMPVHPELTTAYRLGAYQDYFAFLESLAYRFGFSFLDAHDPELFPESDFYNSVHLNADGQVKLTDWITNKVFGRHHQPIETARIHQSPKRGVVPEQG